MIDWFNLLANSLRIAGCALALAILSYARWQASVQHEPFRLQLGKPRCQAGLYLAGVLFCVGLMFALTSSVEKVIWLVLGGFCLLQLIRSLRSDLQ